MIKHSRIKKEDRYFRGAFTIVRVAGIVLTAWDFIFLQGSHYRFSTMSITGLAFWTFGLTLRIVSRLTLGKYFSPVLGIRDDHRLLKNGIYKYLRHPAYTGAIIADMGTPLVFSSLYGCLVMLLLIPLILYRIGIEERMLIGKFGDEYLAYMQHTKRLLPYIY